MSSTHLRGILPLESPFRGMQLLLARGGNGIVSSVAISLVRSREIERSARIRDSVFEGNVERADGQPNESDPSDSSDSTSESGSSEGTVPKIVASSSTYARAIEMSGPPVSFVVGEPELEPGADPNEMLENEDSFPEDDNAGSGQLLTVPTTGLVERRKRLR